MKLTEKDRQFLTTLRSLCEARELQVEMRLGRPSYFVVRGTYGEKIHQAFGMSRQGVRWRFQRLFNDVYVSAFETILFIERTFGSAHRQDAVRISQERHALREPLTARFQTASALQHRRAAASEPRVREVNE